MKTTESTIVELPTLFVPGMTEVEGKGLDEIEEMNLLSYNYANSSAISTIDNYVLTPFANSFKQGAITKVMNEHNVNDEGVYKGWSQVSEIIEDKKLVADAGSQTSTGWDAVIAGLKDILDNVVSDNMDKIHQDGVRKIVNETYISVDYIKLVFDRLIKEKSSKGNKVNFTIYDPKSDPKKPKTFKLAEDVTSMAVHLDDKVMREINPKNAYEYVKGEKLKSELNKFLRSFEKWAMSIYGIKTEGLEQSQPKPVTMSDSSRATYLFFPKSERPKAKNVYLALAAYDPEKVEVIPKTGDLQVITEHAFNKDVNKDGYTKPYYGSTISVSTKGTDKKGTITIHREMKNGDVSQATYKVINNEGKVYVSARDIIGVIEELSNKNGKVPKTNIKIDFFPAKPLYLRN